MKKTRSRLATTRSKYDGIIRARRQNFVDTDKDAARAAAIAAAMKARIESAVPDYIATVREWAAKTLRAAGLPDTLRHVQRHPDGTWTELPADFWKAIDDLPDTELPGSFWNDPDLHDSDWAAVVDQIKGASITVTNATTLAGAPPADKQAIPLKWHACQLLDSMAALEHAVATGDAQRAAAAGIELGGRWQQAIFADRFEKYAAVGIAQSGHGSDGGKRGGRPGMSSEEQAGLQAIADEFWRKEPGLSKESVASKAKAKSQCSHSVRTVRRHLKKPA